MSYSHKYRSPDEVVYDTTLSQSEKLTILKRWKASMDHRISPDEDNDIKTPSPSTASIRKQDIDEALQQLEDPVHRYGLSKKDTRH